MTARCLHKAQATRRRPMAARHPEATRRRMMMKWLETHRQPKAARRPEATRRRRLKLRPPAEEEAMETRRHFRNCNR